MTVGFGLNSERDLNHLHVIIKLNTVPPYVTTQFNYKSLCKISTVECSRETGSSIALVFPGEVFIHSSVIASILSNDRSLKKTNTVHYRCRQSKTDVTLNYAVSILSN
jgi:hypothetical protein